MQTFLPSSDLRQSVEFLDDKRLGKQRVETKQILLALGVSVGQHDGSKPSQWKNHPAVKMWKGYEAALALYGYFCCREWKRRGFKDVLESQFTEVLNKLTGRNTVLTNSGTDHGNFIGGDPKILSPWWLGFPALHRSHRANLVRKEPEYYSVYFTERNHVPYYWPV